MKKTVVSIVRGDDPKELVKKSISLIGGIEKAVKQGDVVMVKPNLVSALPPSSGATTDPQIVEGLVELSQEAGAKSVIIGEGSSGADTTTAFQICGYDKVAKRTGVKLVDLNRDEIIQVKVEDATILKSFNVAKTVVQSDVIINAPKMKTNMGSVISGGLKNMLGILPGKYLNPGPWKDQGPKTNILDCHVGGLNYAIVDLNRAFKPNLVVMDAFVGMEGAGPIEGDPVELKTVIAGFNPVAVDAIEATIMGFNAQKIGHIYLASKAELGVCDLRFIEVRGESLKRVIHPFRPCLRAHRRDFGHDALVQVR